MREKRGIDLFIRSLVPAVSNVHISILNLHLATYSGCYEGELLNHSQNDNISTGHNATKEKGPSKSSERAFLYVH